MLLADTERTPNTKQGIRSTFAFAKKAFTNYVDRSCCRFDALQCVALLAMRLVLGVIIVAHGYPKVFGGMSDEMQFVASLGIPAWMAYLSAYTELFGGSLVFLGLFTRAASVPICINLGVAICGNEGLELALAVFILAFALIFLGPGSIALDQILRGTSAVRLLNDQPIS
jgi:putative oxidoreductase